jgi:hypothetical protein
MLLSNDRMMLQSSEGMSDSGLPRRPSAEGFLAMEELYF